MEEKTPQNLKNCAFHSTTHCLFITSSSHIHPQKRSNSQQLDGGKRALMCSSVLKINTSETVCVTAGLNTYKTLSLPMERAQIRLMI